MTITKTNLTLELERNIWGVTSKTGVFGCFEVTINFFGEERVDYLTYNTKGVWRCYEIKVSKPDFNSKAHKTFIGHYNYYVMPKELYEQVKDDIPSDIGVYIGKACVKKAKKRTLGIDEQILKDSLIRSLYREAEKQIQGNTPSVVESLKRQVKQARKERDEYRIEYWGLLYKTQEKYGAKWYKE